MTQAEFVPTIDTYHSVIASAAFTVVSNVYVWFTEETLVFGDNPLKVMRAHHAIKPRDAGSFPAPLTLAETRSSMLNIGTSAVSWSGNMRSNDLSTTWPGPAVGAGAP